jgi:two-component system, cell cycle response regulator
MVGADRQGFELMSKANILIVEDNAAQAEFVRNFLGKNGYNVTWVQDGMAAFRVAKTEPVDLILLDLILPDIDGNDVCRWLKTDAKTRSIPIIMLTARDSVPDKVTGLEAGADDYLPKPFHESELSTRIFARLRAKADQDDLLQKNHRLEEMLMRVESLAVIDSLTGLFNRRRFETLLNGEFKRARRYSTPLSCMMIDIDHFKEINDAFGHQTGDLVLRDVAKLIQAGIREIDSAARWGGEEFVVLHPNTVKNNAMPAAARILDSVNHHDFGDMGGRRVTVSIGIADISSPTIGTTDNLIHAADLAMYEAKKKGRNCIELA